MAKTFIKVMAKLTLLAALSSVGLFTIPRAQAHELQPTIADVTVSNGTISLVLRLNVEALLADIDLDAVQDTNDAENAADYDTLRALSGDEIARRAPELLKGWNALPMVAVDGQAVTLGAQTLEMPQDVDIELPRISTWTLQGSVPSEAGTLNITWPQGAGAIVVRQQGVDEPFTGYLNGGETSEAISLAGGNEMTGLQAFGYYVPVGFDHILPKGLDHILFVLGLFLLSTHLRPLLWQVSAFTLAHTVTLALGAMGWVTVPGSIVEPLIAASIVYVAVENIYLGGLSRWRPFVIFGFGLLHGLGFASVLGEFGLPAGQFLPALIGFNIGVELGQLTVIAMAAAVIWFALRAAWVANLEGEEVLVREYPVMFRAVSISGSLIIAIIGAYWVVERVFF